MLGSYHVLTRFGEAKLPPLFPRGDVKLHHSYTRAAVHCGCGLQSRGASLLNWLSGCLRTAHDASPAWRHHAQVATSLEL